MSFSEVPSKPRSCRSREDKKQRETVKTSCDNHDPASAGEAVDLRGAALVLETGLGCVKGKVTGD